MAFCRWFFSKDLGDPDAGLVEGHEGDGHHHLREGIRRGEDGCHNEDDDDHIFSVARQHPGIDHPQPGEEEQEEGKLKGEAEGEQEHGAEGE